MIQSRQQRHRKKKSSVRWVLLGAALAVGAGVTVASQWMPRSSPEQAAPDSNGAPLAVSPKPNSSAGAAESGKGGTGQSGTVDSAPGKAIAAPAAEKAPEGAAAKAPVDGSRVRMAFVGDILLADGVEKLMQQNGYDYPYSGLGKLLSEPDVAIANLETPVTEKGSKQTKEFVYRSSPKALPALRNAGIDLVNTANNHIMDYGSEGLLDTLANLDEGGIPHIGTGRNLDEALKPVMVTKQGIRIAFLGFSRVVPDNSWKASSKQAGVADTYNYIVPVETIQKAKEQADIVVVIAHWGTERKDTPDPVQTDLAHRYIDAGADLVVASHPHVLQGVEAYKGKWIAYSLGNFIFTTNDNPKTWETMVLQAECAKNGDCSLKAVPILTKWAKPEPLLGDAGTKLLERVSKLSYRSRIETDGTIAQDASAAAPPAVPPPPPPAAAATPVAKPTTTLKK